MGHYEGYFSDFVFKFCNNLLIKTKTHTVQVSAYRIREESVYGVHNMKNIIEITGIFYSVSWKRSSLRPLHHPIYSICTNYNIDIMYQVFLCNWFNINMWVPISIGGLFSEKILLSVRNFSTFVSKITTFNLFKKYYNTHLQSKTFYILNILSLTVIKITKRNKFRRYLTSY
jgi:hypothetical protein